MAREQRFLDAAREGQLGVVRELLVPGAAAKSPVDKAGKTAAAVACSTAAPALKSLRAEIRSMLQIAQLVQQYPGGPQHSQSVHILEEMHLVRERAGKFTVTWGGHVSSLDVMLLVRGHLHMLATLATQSGAPSEQHTLASAPTSSSSCSGGRSAGQVAMTPMMTDSLKAVFAVLCPLMDDFLACAQESRPQECLRALMQLVATPDIVTALLHLTLSPAMLAAAADRSHTLCQRASSCINGLHHMLRTFYVAAAVAMKGAGPAGRSNWWGLLNKMEHFFALQQNIPYLEPLVLTPTLGRKTTPPSGGSQCWRAATSWRCPSLMVALAQKLKGAALSELQELVSICRGEKKCEAPGCEAWMQAATFLHIVTAATLTPASMGLPKDPARVELCWLFMSADLAGVMVDLVDCLLRWQRTAATDAPSPPLPGTSTPWMGPPSLSSASPLASSSATIPTSGPVKRKAKPPGSKQLRQQHTPQHIPDDAKSHLLHMYARMLLEALEDADVIWQLLQHEWRVLDWLEAVTDIDQAGAKALIKGVWRLLDAGGAPAREQVVARVRQGRLQNLFTLPARYPETQSFAGAVHRLLAKHYPADFPPSLFIHTGRSLLDPSTQVSEEIRVNGLRGVFNHLAVCGEDAAADHADLIHLAVSTLTSRGGWAITPGTVYLAMELLQLEGVRDQALCANHLFKHTGALELVIDQLTSKPTRTCTFLAAQLLHVWCADVQAPPSALRKVATPAVFAALVGVATRLATVWSESIPGEVDVRWEQGMVKCSRVAAARTLFLLARRAAEQGILSAGGPSRAA